PGTSDVLFTEGTQGAYYETAKIDVLSRKTGQIKTLIRGAYFGRFFRGSSGKGFLVYVHEGTIFSVPFDPERLELAGSPVSVITGVAAEFSSGGGQFDVSQNGILVYQAGRNVGRTFSWMDSAGKTSPLALKPSVYWAPKLSRSGKKLAYAQSGPGGADLWVYDVARETPTQLTSGNTLRGASTIIW